MEDEGAPEYRPVYGFNPDRLGIPDATGRLEQALAEAWAEANRPRPWLNYGHGTLQDLFMRPVIMGSRTTLFGGRAAHVLTDNERMVAATVVQWLGTNCGREFLRQSFQRAGWLWEVRPPPRKKGSQ